VTSTSYSGDLGGLAGADEKCQERAEAAGFSGTWIALLSTSSMDARDRVPDTEFRRIDGAVIATDKSDLFDGTIDNPINITELNTHVFADVVWTGSFEDGTAANNCEDWATSSEEYTGMIGHTHPDHSWISYSDLPLCINENRLYCVMTSRFPYAILSVDDQNPCAGDTVIFTVEGYDDIDVRDLWFYDGIWNSQSCEGVQTECTKQWEKIEGVGSYQYYGYIYDDEGNGAWSTPQSLSVEFEDCGIIPPGQPENLANCDLNNNQVIDGEDETFYGMVMSYEGTEDTLDLNDDYVLNDDDIVVLNQHMHEPVNSEPVTCGCPDINKDNVVDISDLVTVGNHFGELSGDENWDPRADVKPDGEIDIPDLVCIGKHFGEEDVCEESEKRDKYSEKQVFLISDENWKDILSLVPLTTWTTEKITDCAPDDERDWCWCNRLPEDYINLETKGVCAYPLLIYHREDFDYVSHREIIASIDGIYYTDPAISGDRIVWRDGRDGNWDIYMCDLGIEEGEGSCRAEYGKIRITTIPSSQEHPAISGDIIVWGDERNKNEDIYMCDLSLNGEYGGCHDDDEKIQITSDASDQYNPTISGDIIVWEDYRNENSDSYMYNLSADEDDDGIPNYLENDETGGRPDPDPAEMQITKTPSQWEPTISGSKIVWRDRRNGNLDIYMCDLTKNGKDGGCLTDDEETPLVINPSDQYTPVISGDTIVWVDKMPPENENPAICIYNEEGATIHHESFDADSIIYFMQQYAPDNVILIREPPQELKNLLTRPVEDEVSGAGLREEQIHTRGVSDYLSYWDQSKLESIVYVEDNYELVLLASSYASLINTPLIVEGSSLDDLQDGYIGDPCVFDNKEIILVGSQEWLNSFTCPPKAKSCTDTLTMNELQERYISLTNTDKIVLTNPDDLSIDIQQYIKPKKSMEKNIVLYSKTSLVAPILASAKHELIIPIKSTDYEEIDSELESKMDEFFPDLLEREGAIERDYVWNDYKRGNYDVHVCDISLNGKYGGCHVEDEKIQLTTDPTSQIEQVISGDRIVWRDYRHGSDDSYMYDLSADEDGDGVPNYLEIDETGGRPDPDPAEMQIITDTLYEWQISGDRIVGEAYSDIYIYMI